MSSVLEVESLARRTDLYSLSPPSAELLTAPPFYSLLLPPSSLNKQHRRVDQTSGLLPGVLCVDIVQLHQTNQS